MFKEKKKGIEFQTNKGKFMLPSKLYPLASKKNVHMFHHHNTEKLDNDSMKQALNDAISTHYDQGVGKSGYCYRNASLVLSAAKEYGLEATYYAGWIFFGGGRTPIHHAWAVIDGHHLVDLTMNPDEMELLRTVDFSDPDWRKEAAKKVKEAAKNQRKVEHRVFGKVPDNTVYIGSPDTMENSVKIFNKLRSDYPDHPSYNEGGTSMDGRSAFQTELER